jgi:hypothetical protein
MNIQFMDSAVIKMATNRQRAMLYSGDSYLQTVKEGRENSAMDEAFATSKEMNAKVWRSENIQKA